MEPEDQVKLIEALEKKVAALTAEVAKLKQSTTGPDLLSALREAEQRYG